MDNYYSQIKEQIKNYSIKLTNEFGKVYTLTNLKMMRKFYILTKSHTLCDYLSWSHYRLLLSMDNTKLNYYIKISYYLTLSTFLCILLLANESMGIGNGSLCPLLFFYTFFHYIYTY